MAIALLPFKKPITEATGCFGGIAMHMCTWSGIKCPSTIWHSFCFASAWNTGPSWRRIFPKIAFRRRFGTNTTWYLQSHLEWARALAQGNSISNESNLSDAPLLFAAGCDFRFETVKGVAQWGGDGGCLRHDLREFGSQQVGIGAGKEERDAQAVRRELVAMAVGNALDDTVQTEPPQIVSHPSGGVMGWIQTQQLRQQLAHFRVGKATYLETENDQHGEQGLHPGVAEFQRGSALAFDRYGPDHLIQGVFANGAVVRDLLDIEQTSVGLKADLPQSGQVVKSFADTEVAGIVDGGFRAKGTAL